MSVYGRGIKTSEEDAESTTKYILGDEAEWKLIQKNTFTRWVNERLKLVNKSIENIEQDFSDGLNLISLLEVLSGKKFQKYTKKPLFRPQKLENVTMALKFLQVSEKIKIVNIDSSDIVDHNAKLILGLIWKLILHYAIATPNLDLDDFVESETRHVPQKQVDLSPKQRLLQWIKSKVPDLEIKNFTSDWNDGRAIGALVDGVAPGLCPDWDIWKQSEGLKNSREAMTLAEDWLDVPQLIRPEEMCNPRVDEMSVMTYLSQFPSSQLKPGAPLRPRSGRSKCRVFGSGLRQKGLRVGEEAEFSVETKQEGEGGRLQVELEEPDGNVKMVETFFNNDKYSTYSCFFTPRLEGLHRVGIFFDGHEIPKSPFQVEVSGFVENVGRKAGDVSRRATLSTSDGEVMDLSKCTVGGKGIQKTGLRVGDVATVKITVPDAAVGRELKVELTNVEGTTEACSLVQVNNYEFTCDYLPTAPGVYGVRVTHKGKHIGKSPYAIEVKGPTECPVKAFGPGLSRGMVGHPASFCLETNGDAGALAFSIEGPSKAEIDCVDHEDGSASISYHPVQAGWYAVHILCDDRDIRGSPFVATVVEPPEGEDSGSSRVKVSGSIALGEIQAVGVQSRFEVDARPAGQGIPEVSLWDAEGNPVDVVTLGDRNGIHEYEVRPERTGRYTLLVSYDGLLTPGSPFKFTASVPSDPSKVVLHGPAVEGRVRQHETTYLLVDCSKAGPGDVAIMLSDREGNDVPMETEEFGSSSFKVIFRPTRAGRVEGKVFFSEREIPSSPFRFDVAPAVDPSKIVVCGLERQSFLESPMAFTIDTRGAAAAATTTDLSAKVETPSGRSLNVPLQVGQDGSYRGSLTMMEEGRHVVTFCCDGEPFRTEVIQGRSGCDPTKVEIIGAGTKSGFTDEPQSFMVRTAGAGRGGLEVSIRGPSEVEATSTDTGDGTTTRVEYLPPSRGTYKVSVLFGGDHVPGSPFSVDIRDDVRPSEMRFDDFERINAKKDHESKFEIDARSSGRSDLKVVAIDPRGESKSLPASSDSDGIWSISFLPECEGLYTMEVWYGGERVRKSKVQVHPSFDASRLKLEGPGVGERVFVGEEAAFRVDATEAGEAELVVKIEDHFGAPVECKTTRDGSSSYKVEYLPEEIGHCLLDVFYGGDEVPGCPRRVAVLPSGEASRVKIAGGADDTIPVGREVRIQLSHSDAGNGRVRCHVVNDKLEKVPADVLEVGPGKSEVAYLPERPGTYKVRMSFGGRAIPGGTFEQKALNRKEFDQWEDRVAKSQSLKVVTNGNEIPKSATDAIDGNCFRDYFFNIPTGPVFGFIKAEVSTPNGTTDVPRVVDDNADGTVTIKYLPTTSGPHSLSVTCNGDPVDGFHPLHFLVESSSGAGKIKASGAGLTTGICSSTCSFNISLGDSDAGSMAISIEGPSKVSIDLEDNGDGSVNVCYRPELPGDYSISVSHSHQHVQGSPFTAKIFPLLKDSTLAQMSIGSKNSEPLNLGLEATARDLSRLTCRVTSPSGTNQIAVPRILEGHKIGVLFEAKEPGMYTFEVLKNDVPLHDQPIQRHVTAAQCSNSDSVKVFGAGLIRPKTGVCNEFFVDYRNAGRGGLDLSMDGPDRVCMECLEDKDGVCRIGFEPRRPGTYVLTVLFSSEHVIGSPFLLDVTGDCNAESEPVVIESAIQSYSAMSHVGKESLLNLMIPASTKDGLRVFVKGPSGFLDSCYFAPSQNSDGHHYSVGFTPQETGIHLVYVSAGKAPLPGSPFTFIVGPLFATNGDQSKIKVFGPGLSGGYVDNPGLITIDSKLAGEGNLSITMEGVLKPDISFRDKHNGTCDIVYTCGKPGDYLLSIKFNGKHIRGSPFAIVIKGSDPASRPSVVSGKAFNPNEPACLELVGDQSEGRVEAVVTSPSGSQILPIVQERNSGGYVVRFIPRESGLHLVDAFLNGKPFGDSPYKVFVGLLLPDPSKVTCSGSGLSFGRTGELSEFTISTEGSGFGPLEVSVDGPSQVNLACHNTSERPLKFFYKPSSPGVYKINVSFAGKAIPLSPFHAEVLGSGKPLPWNEVSNFNLEIFPEESSHSFSGDNNGKTSKQNDLSSDSRLVICSGDGLSTASAQQPAEFYVDATATDYQQMLSIKVDGPTGKCRDVEIATVAPKKYFVAYQPEEIGPHTVKIYWGKSQVQGSPFHVSVTQSTIF